MMKVSGAIRPEFVLLGLLALCFTVALTPVFGQAQSRLTGTVTDVSNAVIPGAQVTVRNIATGITSSATTNETGTYNFPFLLPGEYSLTCSSAGFKTHSQSGLVLDTNFTRTVNVRLEIGEVTETIEVIARTPLLESENATIGQLIEQSNVINMPLESRRSASLVRLMGAVAYKFESGPEQAPKFSMGGGRSYNQMWQLDGAVVQNMALGVAMLSINPPAESLQEFKVESNNYAAEYGRAGGGLILMTTKSGTNNYHGNAYWFLRNDALDARTFFDPGKAPLRYNIFGASIGGPVKEDKAFFFFNYEGARRRDGVTISNHTVPLPENLTGDFSRRTAAVLDPLTGNPFPGNMIPSARLDPMALKFAKLYPAPNKATDPTKAPTTNFVANTSNQVDQDFYTSRIDWNATDNDRIYGRYSFVRAPETVGNVWSTRAADPNAGLKQNKNHNPVVSWLHSYTPTLIQEVRFNMQRRMHINRGAGTGSGLNGEFGLGGVNPEALGRVTITGYTRIGQNNHERIQIPILTQQYYYNLTKVRGNHTTKTGFELRYSRNGDDQNNATGGRFSFNNRATKEGLATFLLGWTTSGQILDTLLLMTRTDYYGWYIQDDWKITPNFTLNLGVRWELDTPRWEREDNRQSSFEFDPINPVSGTPGVIVFSGRDGRSKYAHDFDKNNWGPRFGFAWRVQPSTVIRGGYGLSYLGAYKTAVPNRSSLGFAVNQNYSSPDGGFTPAFLLNVGMPAPDAQPELWPGFGAVPVGGKTTTNPDFFLQNLANGYMQQWNLAVQQDIGFNSIIEIGYLANVGHRLGGNNVNLNMIPLDENGMGPVKQDQTLRPFPQFSGVTLNSPPWGNSTYHALNVKWEKRYSEGLNFLANYTFSKFIDDVEGNQELAGGAGGGYTHIERRKLDKSLSGNDIRNRFVASTVYELPIGRGRSVDVQSGLLDALVGGWGVGAVLELRDGLPWGVVEQTNRTNAFSAGNRSNIEGSPMLEGNRPRGEYLQEWFNTSAFTDPGVGVFGNAARAYCCGPGTAMFDLSVHKWFRITERYRLMFRTDFYNLPNRPHFELPNTNRGHANFGRITSVMPGTVPRRIQFSLKLQF